MAGSATQSRILPQREPETPAGYFHYFVERNDVDEEAIRVAEETFYGPRDDTSGIADPADGT
jgi:hypothetical protein